MRQSGWPQIFPSRSWSAPSTAHLAAIWPGELAEAVEDRARRERIVAEQRPHVLEDPGMGGVRPLVVVLVRSALAVADQTVVRDRDLDDPGVRVGRAGDDERLEVLERDDPRVELHRRQRIRPVRPRPVESSPRACSSGDRACASGAQGRRFDSYQAHSSAQPCGFSHLPSGLETQAGQVDRPGWRPPRQGIPGRPSDGVPAAAASSATVAGGASQRQIAAARHRGSSPPIRRGW